MDFLHPSFLRQLRAARALLGWSQKELSASSGVSLSTLNRLERGDGDPSISSLRMIQKAFEAAGVRFLNAPDQSIGVVLSAEGLAHAEQAGSKMGD
jgi:transcriptional regulator with XRE-family HTH domain